MNINLKDYNISRIFKGIVRRILDIPQSIAWDFPSPAAKINRNKLQKFKDIHKGKRCFIIANGPSLANMDLSLLKNEITLGMNRIYLMEEMNGFKPTYLLCVDINNQLKQFTDEYDKLTINKFFIWNKRKLFHDMENLHYIKASFNPRFRKDITKRVGNGKSVTYACMHLAYYMGFKEVILIGKDHNYDTRGISEVKLIKSTGNENNHFIKGYYKKGMTFGVPDFKKEEYNYRLAKQAFEADGRKILDATIDGKLDVFEKVDYYSLF